MVKELDLIKGILSPQKGFFYYNRDHMQSGSWSFHHFKKDFSVVIVTAVRLVVLHIMGWDLCASSPNITMKVCAQMKACAREVVIETDCHVSPQCQLGGLTAVSPYFSFFLYFNTKYIPVYAECLGASPEKH